MLAACDLAQHYYPVRTCLGQPSHCSHFYFNLWCILHHLSHSRVTAISYLHLSTQTPALPWGKNPQCLFIQIWPYLTFYSLTIWSTNSLRINTIFCWKQISQYFSHFYQKGEFLNKLLTSNHILASLKRSTTLIKYKTYRLLMNDYFYSDEDFKG